ncbi:MAG: 30S ribosomal protein S13 [Candidatus Lokiarchaeota archaeon]|nr:30S ribosomal protein S13 [Candidatus Lokiarchaeota archaeon]MBD3198464.1 30S ribosomal protein S13 [Candidatus Lokiarchaeota archaeon]
MSTPIRPANFREQVFFRKLRTRVDGNAKVEYGLTQIKGVGKRFAQAVVRSANVDPSLRIGAIPEKDLNQLEEIIMNPEGHLPHFLLNRRKDLVRGSDRHILSNELEITVKRDIDRMKRMKSYKGIRHQRGLKVRGQRTKSTGRHGLVIGVQRKKLRQQLAKKKKKKEEAKK